MSASIGSFDAATLLAFFVGCVVIVLLPGANSLYVLTTAVRSGVSGGMRATLGVFTGDSVLALVAIFGAQALSRAPVVYTVLIWAGALYLLWLAFGLIRSAVGRIRAVRAGRREPAPVEDPVHPQTVPIPIVSQPRLRPFRTALITSVLNPKAILFFASFFVQFLRPDSGTPVLDVLLLVGIMQATSMVYLATLTLVGSQIGTRVQPHGAVAIVGTFVAAAAFIVMAVRVVLP